MALSDVILQNFMPRNILDSDDEADTWSLGGRSSGSSSVSGDSQTSTGSPSSYMPVKDAQQDFRLFGDYFGLSNLLNNIKISDDNPLLYSTQKNLALLQKSRRMSWESDGSDPSAVISPGIESHTSYSYDGGFMNDVDGYTRDRSVSEPVCKQLPPPSMRLSKAMRDHIISGAYQQTFNNRHADKFNPQGMPPHNPQNIPVPVSQNHPMPPQVSGQPNSAPPRSQPGLQVCVFCRNNKESESVYTSHVLKDSEGRTVCPILRAYTCPICKANGDNSHTIKYCPENQNARMMQLAGQHHPFGQSNGFRNHHQQQRNFRPQLPNPMSMNQGNMSHHSHHQPGKLRP